MVFGDRDSSLNLLKGSLLECKSDLAKVAFGERDGVCIGHALLAVNGEPLTYKELPDGRDVFEVHNVSSNEITHQFQNSKYRLHPCVFQVLADKSNFPLNLKFGRPTITTNEKIVLASIFYPLFALAVQLSPEQVTSNNDDVPFANFGAPASNFQGLFLPFFFVQGFLWHPRNRD